jgi:Trk K+ transport system NAD-binding subunit/Kef-type K+ transport system membrane component KefB
VLVVVALAGFVVVALAARQIGTIAARARLPLITGFLLTGIVAGPHVIGLIPPGTAERLRFVDQISLAFIAFAAGAEISASSLRGRWKSIGWVTGGLVGVTLAVGGAGFYLLSGHIPFLQAFGPANRAGIALLAAAILVARSPSSAIAIVSELRARGPLTRTALGVTIISDVVVIVVFAISISVADALLRGLGFDARFLLTLTAELAGAFAAGYLLGRILTAVLSFRVAGAWKIAAILVSGYAAFAGMATLRTATSDSALGEISIEPLLVCMVAGFYVVNFSGYRMEFARLLETIAPAVYVAFFTLTGATLALDVLAGTWPIAVALVLLRLVSIFTGSLFGGIAAGEPARLTRIGWMVYITQAGVGLGLAKEVADEFPAWGPAFATLLIAVIVLNQIIGPPLFKWAIHRAGEAHVRAEREDAGSRDVLIFGLEGQSLALARELRKHRWNARVASRKAASLAEAADADVPIVPIADLTVEEMRRLGADRAGALVLMLSDEENLRLCEMAFEHFGTPQLVVRLSDRANAPRFVELGARVVEPGTAMVSLLDQSVRSPAAASLLLGMEAGQQVADVELRNDRLHGIALRDLQLPLETLVLSVRRGGHAIVSHGYTRLETGDRVTVLGPPASLDEIARRFEPGA